MSASTGFVCLQCGRVWTHDGQPETNMMALAAASIELLHNGGPQAPNSTHCNVCDDGKKGPHSDPTTLTSWVLPDGRTVTPETETLLDFLEYSAHECAQKLKECQPLSDSYSFWSGSTWAYSFALGRCRAENAQREAAVRSMVEKGECICMEVVDDVLRPSETFVHPNCPQHSG